MQREYELVVVDNGSKDGSYEMIKSFLSVVNVNNVQIKLIRLRRNVGFTGGNNIAYELWIHNLNTLYY